MPVLTDLDSLKTYLGITGSDEDTKLTQILNAVDDAIERWTGRKLASQAHTEYHDGNDRNLLVLNHRPVTVVTSVHVDFDGYYGHGAGAFPASTEWTLGTDFAPKRLDESEENGGLLIALKGLDFGDNRGVWPCGQGNIKVAYTAGYTTIPDDIQLAAWLLATDLRKSSEKGVGGPLKSERFGRYAYERMRGADAQGSTATPEITEAVSLLAGYMEVDF